MRMILIDKAKDIQTLVLTISELTTIENVKYLMVVKSDALREVHYYTLPINQSSSISRYDLFKVNTAVFVDLVTGYYTYSIYQQEQLDNSTDESLLGSSIESGKLLVIGEKIPVEIISPIRNDDYLIY